MATVMLFFGIQFVMMGLVTEYLYRIFSESTRRPLYFIQNEITSTDLVKLHQIDEISNAGAG
jgi:hypothetical protein